MSKEKEIIMDEKELEKMLKGSLYWNDISDRLDGSQRRSGIRQLKDPLLSRVSEQKEVEREQAKQDQNLKEKLPLNEIDKRTAAKAAIEQDVALPCDRERPQLQWNLNSQELTYHSIKWEPDRSKLLDEMFNGEPDEDDADVAAAYSQKRMEGHSVIFVVTSICLITIVLWVYYLSI